MASRLPRKLPFCGESTLEGMAKLIRMPPRGHYLAAEAGRLAGVSGDQIGQWARHDYIRSSQSDAIPRVYSYQDVAEAMVVHQLRLNEVSYDDIRTALQGLRDDTELGDWPLQAVTLKTIDSPKRPGRLVVVREGEHFDVSGRPWHGAIDVGDLVRIAADLNRGGWAARELPDLTHIEVNPDRLSGRPVIRGRRVPARDVAELAVTEEGLAVLTDEYELDADEIQDARRWWEVASRYEAA
jgi:uncharacterized protein (DUF433 family)